MVSPRTTADAQFTAFLGWPVALIGLFLLVFAVVALSSPGRIDIVDGQTRYEVARSLIDHGDCIIRDEATWMAVLKGRDGQAYSNYRLPHSVLGVVAIVLADASGPVDECYRQFLFSHIGACVAGLLAVVYALWFRGLGHSPLASVAWGAAGIFCTPNWFYATSTFDDLLGAAGIVAAAAAAWLGRVRHPVLGATIAGLAMAWAINCKPPLIVFALPVLAAGYVPQWPWRRQLLPAALLGLGVLAGVVVYQAYEHYKFPPGNNLNVMLSGNTVSVAWTPNPLPGLASFALSPSCGVLWYCPTLFLSWRGWRTWRQRQSLFCSTVVVASLVFTVFLCFLTFFKGEPCWGPRYLTPAFALAWVFVPAGLAATRAALGKTVLALGVAVQLLGLSVDAQRLFVQIPLYWNYYEDFPWLGFDGAISHLYQRPREIVEILTPTDTPVPAYSHGPLPTHAGGFYTAPTLAASVVALMAGPHSPAPLNGTTALLPVASVQTPVVTKWALKRYHIFNSPRPWVFSQWYLAPEARPVDLAKTVSLLGCLAGAGLALMLAGFSGVGARQRACHARPAIADARLPNPDSPPPTQPSRTQGANNGCDY